MASIRYCFMAIAFALSTVNTFAQTVFYPANASQLLKETAVDLAIQLQLSIAGSNFSSQPFATRPSTGIILQYDSSISDNQLCKVKSDGHSYISFTALQDNGLHFGVYQFLHQLGFRFYLPGKIWEISPSLTSAFIIIDTVYSSPFRYKNWFISGGYNNWVMDKSRHYDWDTYFGENGHQWALYQRRNGMEGASRFAGHRDDLMTGSYFSALQNNPCYVANYGGSRQATQQSVPDINSNASMQLWGNAIGQQYAAFKNIIFSNQTIYSNIYHNFNYIYGNIGIEVPDGAHWANTNDNSGCSNKNYLKESDQHFTLANYVVNQLQQSAGSKRFQLYAYDGHANVPSSHIVINNQIDVQVAPYAFQNETSPKGLLNRWYKRWNAVSEYHYLNIGQWSGETPAFHLTDLKSTLQRLKDKNSQGIVWEASPAKFASLPFLSAANQFLLSNKNVDSSLSEFCNSLFGGAANTIFKLLNLWTGDGSLNTSNGIMDNKYKLPLYFQLLKEADGKTQHAPLVVKKRINELKAYLHYMDLYYDWVFDQRSNNEKTSKAAALCIYLAKANRLQLVNSYFLITDITSRYPTAGNFYTQYNPLDGSAYNNGNLDLITDADIQTNFVADLQKHSSINTTFIFESADEIAQLFSSAKLQTPEKIKVKIGFTNGKDYTAQSEFYIQAPSVGSFSIKYKPSFAMAGKGNINFTMEGVNQPLLITKDFTISSTDRDGVITIPLPAQGGYKLTISSKYKSSVDVEITTNGNSFFKSGSFCGSSIENYRQHLPSFPGYFHVPAGITRVYFSVNNSNPGGQGFTLPSAVSKAFVFTDNQNNSIEPKLADSKDSAFFYLEIPNNTAGVFLKAFKMEQLRLCFSNISNLLWYANPTLCSPSIFSLETKKIAGNCVVIATAKEMMPVSNWKIYENGLWVNGNNIRSIQLPEYATPNTIVMLSDGAGCQLSKRVGDDPLYANGLVNCEVVAAAPALAEQPSMTIVVYPNPGNGVFYCKKNNQSVLADNVIIYNTYGAKMAAFLNCSHFDISSLSSGTYFFQLIIGSTIERGKLIKQ